MLTITKDSHFSSLEEARKGQMRLTFSSVVEHDIMVSLKLTKTFAHRLSLWLLSRRSEEPGKKGSFVGFRSDSNPLEQHRIFSELAMKITECVEHYSAISRYKKRHTVIRSPFAFKKTVEQFRFRRKTCVVVLKANKIQQEFLLQWLSQLGFPCELKVTCH
jgi:hypothetical protein